MPVTFLDAAGGTETHATLELADGSHEPSISELGEARNGVVVTASTTEGTLKAANAHRKALVVRNLGATDAYVGKTGVTASGAGIGWLVEPGAERAFADREAFVCITASGTTDLAVHEVVSEGAP
jgi:hypothetical protein